MLTPFEPLTAKIANHDSPATPELVALRVLLGLSFASALLLSWPMWISSREFPLVPLLSFIPAFPSHIDLIAPVLLIANLVITLFRPSRLAAIGIIAITVALWIQDQNRIHPWCFVFLLFYAVMAHSWKTKTSNGKTEELTLALKFIVVAVYFWTGFQKLRIAYFQESTPLISSSPLGSIVSQLLQALFWSMPILEIACAVLLATPRFRRAGVAIALVLHCTLIGMLLLGGVNYSAIPWHLFMIGAVLSLFWRSDSSLREILTPGPSGVSKAVRILSGALPALGYIGWWNLYLSFAVYAGSSSGGYAFIDDPNDSLSKAIPSYQVSPENPRLKEVPLDAWGYRVLRSMPSPEPRVLKAVGTSLCRDYSPQGGQMIIFFTDPILPWQRMRREHEYRCENGALVLAPPAQQR